MDRRIVHRFADMRDGSVAVAVAAVRDECSASQ